MQKTLLPELNWRRQSNITVSSIITAHLSVFSWNLSFQYTEAVVQICYTELL